MALFSIPKAEYSSELISPALGLTGNNLQDYFSDVLKEIEIPNDDYRIILMNSIQYQCSLGERPDFYRDNMWLKLWFNENLKEDFMWRLSSYHPDIVINMCTLGDHKSQKDLPDGCKTAINKKYIEHCIYPLKSPYSKKTTLRRIVSDTVISTNKDIILYECNNPSSWKRNNKNFEISKIDFNSLKK